MRVRKGCNELEADYYLREAALQKLHQMLHEDYAFSEL